MADDQVILERLRDSVSQMAATIGKAFGLPSQMMGVDTLNAVVLGFIFFAAVVVIASNILYRKKKDDDEPKRKNSKSSASPIPTSSESTYTPVSWKTAGRQPVEEVFVSSCVNKVESQAPVSRQSSRVAGSPIPRGPDNDSVQWIDNVLQWFYGPNGASCFHKIEDIWLTTLNSQAKKTAQESGVQLIFEKVESGSNIPKLDNVNVSMDSQEIAAVRADVVATNLGFGVQVSGQKGEAMWSRRLSVNIDRLTGLLRIACIAEELLFIVKFEGQPNMILSISSPSENNETMQNDKEQQALDLVIKDTVSTAITSAIVDLTMSSCPEFPRFQRTQVVAEPILPVGYDSLVNSTSSGKPNRKLLVKVIKATNLGESIGCKQPYVIIEMDSPAQKYQTTTVNGTSSPFWDEHFLFDLNEKQSELLFEVYDKSKPVNNFLGLGIVNQEELLQAPSQRQIIPLQSRPLEHDKVSGSLTVEFLFMEGAEIPNVSPTKYGNLGSEQVETHSRLTPGSPVPNGVESLTDAALRELENMGRSSPNTTTNKSTLIIHSVQREPVRPTVKLHLTKNGKWHEVSQDGGKGPEGEQDKGATLGSASSSSSKEGGDGRSRSKDKKSLMGTLKRRLSLKKKRSKSGSANQGQDDSTRSSISDVSGLSSSSTRTYLHEASTLVVETNENGVVKHYLIPSSLAKKSKWRKRGTKLHIYNDHIFLATHLPGSTTCQICHKLVPRRLGKQGYVCRDCLLTCHKQCHVRADGHCPNSSVSTMEMEYVQDKNAKTKSS